MAYERIFINLGEGCNFNCKYCMQRGGMKGCLPRELNPAFLDYLKNFKSKNDKTAITFFGGEPLLYWDTIKHIVEELAPLNKFDFGMVSNGSLLTRDKVDFMNANKIGYGLSHDGYITEYTRGRDVLADPQIMANFLSLKNKSISAVMTAKNCDFYEIWDYFNERFGPYGGIYVNVDIIYNIDLPGDMTDFDFEKFARSVDRVCGNMKQSVDSGNGRTREYGLLQAYVQRLSKVLDGEVDLTLPKCGTGVTMLNADLQGNSYLCHNSTFKLGTVWDDEELIRRRFEEHNRFVKSKKCQNCNVMPLCTGGCLLIGPGIAHENFCTLQKILFNKVIETIAIYN